MFPSKNFTPVISCAQADKLERGFFADLDEGGHGLDRIEFIERAAAGVARETLATFYETYRRKPETVFVLAGKGHNGADALLAAKIICPDVTQITVQLFAPLRDYASITASIILDLDENGARIVELFERPEDFEDHGPSGDVLLDGIFGYNFDPSRPNKFADSIKAWGGYSRSWFKLRVAVDVPSAFLFNADLTVACGIVKSQLLSPQNAALHGRLRLAEIGFELRNIHYKDIPFEDGDWHKTAGEDSRVYYRPKSFAASAQTILAESPLIEPREATGDKRAHGHLFIIGGSRTMPGALLMNVRAALRAGVGLVTAFCPESVHAAFAAAAPEAMWVPWPETPAGGLALEGEHLLRERLPRATALLCGSGMGAEPETLALIESIAGSATCPLVLDADALRPQIVTAALRRKTGGENATAGGSEKNPPALVLLPHAGEYERITPALPSAKTAALAKAFTIETPLPANVVIARKGAPTIVEGNDDSPDETISVVVCAGGPVLARGGSGDLLAGITGALCARFAARHGIFQPVLDAVALHAAAGDHLAASAHPETVRITDLLDQLGCCL